MCVFISYSSPNCGRLSPIVTANGDIQCARVGLFASVPANALVSECIDQGRKHTGKFSNLTGFEKQNLNICLFKVYRRWYQLDQIEESCGLRASMT